MRAVRGRIIRIMEGPHRRARGESAVGKAGTYGPEANCPALGSLIIVYCPLFIAARAVAMAIMMARVASTNGHQKIWLGQTRFSVAPIDINNCLPDGYHGTDPDGPPRTTAAAHDSRVIATGTVQTDIRFSSEGLRPSALTAGQCPLGRALVSAMIAPRGGALTRNVSRRNGTVRDFG